MVSANVFRLCEGGAFYHFRSFEKPHFNYTKKLSTEALHPRFCKTAVTGWRSVVRVSKPLTVVGFAVILLSVLC